MRRSLPLYWDRQFWHHIERICLLLNPFSEVVTAIQSNQSSLADVTRYFLYLARILKQDLPSSGLPLGDDLFAGALHVDNLDLSISKRNLTIVIYCMCKSEGSFFNADFVKHCFLAFNKRSAELDIDLCSPCALPWPPLQGRSWGWWGHQIADCQGIFAAHPFNARLVKSWCMDPLLYRVSFDSKCFTGNKLPDSQFYWLQCRQSRSSTAEASPQSSAAWSLTRCRCTTLVCHLLICKSLGVLSQPQLGGLRLVLLQRSWTF